MAWAHPRPQSNDVVFCLFNLNVVWLKNEQMSYRESGLLDKFGKPGEVTAWNPKCFVKVTSDRKSLSLGMFSTVATRYFFHCLQDQLPTSECYEEGNVMLTSNHKVTLCRCELRSLGKRKIQDLTELQFRWLSPLLEEIMCRKLPVPKVLARRRSGFQLNTVLELELEK